MLPVSDTSRLIASLICKKKAYLSTLDRHFRFANGRISGLMVQYNLNKSVLKISLPALGTVRLVECGQIVIPVILKI